MHSLALAMAPWFYVGSFRTRGAGMRNMVAGCACERLGPTQLLLLRRAIACSGSEKPPWVFAAGFGVEAQHLFTLACRGRTTLVEKEWQAW